MTNTEPSALVGRSKVYLASPGVSRPDAKAHLVRFTALCEWHGLTPLLLTEDCAGSVHAPQARRIYESHTEMLRIADAVLVDLQKQRGHESNWGMAFEVGFAAALELPIVVYGAPVLCYAGRVSRTRPYEHDALRKRSKGMVDEDFGMPLNLMLGCSALLVASEEEGISLLAAMLRSWPSSRKGTFDSWLQNRMLDFNALKAPGSTDPSD